MARRFSEFLNEQDEVRIDPATFNLRALFKQLNQQLCDNALPADMPVVFGLTRKGAVAQTHCQTWNTRRGGRLISKKSDLSTLKIVMMNMPWSLEKLKGILAHEMVHALLFVKNIHERNHHGVYFVAHRAKFEARADFKIPMVHEDDHELTATIHREIPPRRVAFLLAQDRSGKYVYRLYQPNLTPDDLLNANKIMDFFHTTLKMPFVVLGITTTPLTATVAVSRKINARDTGIYNLPNNDLSRLVPEKIISHVGALPRFN